MGGARWIPVDDHLAGVKFFKCQLGGSATSASGRLDFGVQPGVKASSVRLMISAVWLLCLLLSRKDLLSTSSPIDSRFTRVRREGQDGSSTLTIIRLLQSFRTMVIMD
jgi:hypothetical protein